MPTYQLEPIWRTTYYNLPPTTPQQPQNLLRPTLMSGLSLGNLTGRRSLSAGQYQGRLGKNVPGGYRGCDSSNLGAVPDFSALRARGQQYYQQGVDLYEQGDVWAAQAMEEFARLDMDPSQIDWENIASRGIDASIDWLASQLKVTPSAGEFVVPDMPGVASYSEFQNWLREAQSTNGRVSPQQQAQATALALLQRQKEQAAMWQRVMTLYSNKARAGYPNVFKNRTTGALIWATDEGAKELRRSPDFVFVRREGKVQQVTRAAISPLSDDSTARYVALGVLGAIGIGAAYFLYMR